MNLTLLYRMWSIHVWKRVLSRLDIIFTWEFTLSTQAALPTGSTILTIAFWAYSCGLPPPTPPMLPLSNPAKNYHQNFYPSYFIRWYLWYLLLASFWLLEVKKSSFANLVAKSENFTLAKNENLRNGLFPDPD